MGVQLPGEVAGLLNDLGYTWPDIDEDKLFELSGQWSAYGGRIATISGEAQTAATEVWTNNHGKAVDAFKTKWEHQQSPAAVLKDGATAAHCLSAALAVCAIVVLALKIYVIVQLIILLVNIIEMVAAAAPTFGASLLEIPVVKEIIGRIINLLINKAIEALLG